MTRFHISKNGTPALCRAKEGNCPLGDNSQHFATEQNAQDYVDNLSQEKYGLLPQVNENELSQEWKEKFLKEKNFNDFVRNNARDIMNEGLFERSEGDIQKQVQDKWTELHYENSLSSLEELNNEQSIEVIRDGIGSNELHGWFREYNSDYKPKIENAIITNPELRNASLNVAHRVYGETTGDNIDYDEFLNKEIEVYRGGNFNLVDNDVFVSYSFDRKVAEKFASKIRGSEVKSLTIKVKDTLGSLQTTGEAEVMVCRKDIDF